MIVESADSTTKCGGIEGGAAAKLDSLLHDTPVGDTTIIHPANVDIDVSKQSNCNIISDSSANKENDGCRSGRSNFRLSTLFDHEMTEVHGRAHISVVGKKKSSDDLTKTEACQALVKLKTAERATLSTLFSNDHVCYCKTQSTII
ncbi:hypothetical protein MAR_013051 [Mya arenaria]|uniref:Uncharacterized protein n=1 Tax=Mya arenaria TaxID=6604 RepID=A0ABY7G0C9_MYAAR|nr:hypothetical protein MAR_013051 [Mya arenaria]